MKHHQSAHLAAMVRTARERQGLSARELASRTGLHASSILRIEHGEVGHPSIDVLRVLATELHISDTDLLVAAGYGDIAQLPTFAPYLRAKYSDLSDDDIATMQRFLEVLTGEAARLGPLNGEDEH